MQMSNKSASRDSTDTAHKISDYVKSIWKVSKQLIQISLRTCEHKVPIAYTLSCIWAWKFTKFEIHIYIIANFQTMLKASAQFQNI